MPDLSQLYVPRIPGVPDDYSIPPERYGLKAEVGPEGGS